MNSYKISTSNTVLVEFSADPNEAQKILRYVRQTFTAWPDRVLLEEV